MTDKKGKPRRVYRKFETPWEVFRKLPESSRHLKTGQTLHALDQFASSVSDTVAAQRMQEAKHNSQRKQGARNRRTGQRNKP